MQQGGGLQQQCARPVQCLTLLPRPVTADWLVADGCVAWWLCLQVHAYVSTGLAGSKFGIRNTHLQVRRLLQAAPVLCGGALQCLQCCHHAARLRWVPCLAVGCLAVCRAACACARMRWGKRLDDDRNTTPSPDNI